MKFWHVYYDGQYKLRNPIGDNYPIPDSTLVVFKSFDMAYEYVTRMNGNCTMNAISKWAKR